jgi:hypothetical protein
LRGAGFGELGIEIHRGVVEVKEVQDVRSLSGVFYNVSGGLERSAHRSLARRIDGALGDEE